MKDIEDFFFQWRNPRPVHARSNAARLFLMRLQRKITCRDPDPLGVPTTGTNRARSRTTHVVADRGVTAMDYRRTR
jgi:hypothetical protein